MNYFAYPTAAERYAKGRPFFHQLAVAKIKEICCTHGSVSRALDVGCGTGQSTVALLDVADQVIGLDSSAGMLSQATSHARVRYVQGCAEQLPFADASFGLLTAALAFHWFDRKKFMIEVRRTLQPGGWLVIYTDGFAGRMIGNDAYEDWNRKGYLVRYPTPPRNTELFTEADAAGYGFLPVASDQFIHEVEFAPDQLVNYLLTQTNIIAAVEAGKEDAKSVRSWLLDSIQPFFARTTETFPFSCQMRFYARDT